MNYQDLELLNNLKEKGAITEEEYQKEKAKILNGEQSSYQGQQSHFVKPMTTAEINSYCMFMHLAQFGGFIIPFAGFVAPVIMWVINKDKSDVIDKNGKIILNWMLSALIYGVGSAILCLVLIGIPLLIALGVCHIVFVIIGATRANEGKLWEYPLSIKFFPVN